MSTKLHLGCGEKILEGFINIDALTEKADLTCFVEQLPFSDESVDMIYACHILEHFDRNLVVDVLKEWNRVLVKGGKLRLSVPNFGACVAQYKMTGNIGEVSGLICGGQRNAFDYHKAIFDEPYLRELLTIAGFGHTHAWDWRSVSHSGVDDYSQAYLPHMQKKNGRLMSLNLQGYKI